ncbi:SRPBCC family protein [Yeosuana marina]|uniref:SRPBCC family protein n=1 Tax=Yeosuana marina TaxID=1565536 RepID=UPI0030C7DDFE
MKIFKYLLFLLLIVIIGFCIYTAVQPNSFKVSKTRTINAPASVIYNNVIDFKNWKTWSSWAEDDSNMKVYLSEQTKGINGSFSWENGDGVGFMKTIQAIPYTTIEQDMEVADFPPASIHWHFDQKKNGSTQVTYNTSGDNLSFGFKVFSILTGGIEKRVNSHYQLNLEKLDSAVVANMAKYSITVNGITEHSGGFYIFNSTSSKITDVNHKVFELLPKLKSYIDKYSISMAGSPFVKYHYLDEENNAAMFSCCIPTTSRVITTENDILTGQLEPFRALKTTLLGNYSNLQEAWQNTMTYITEHDLVIDETGPKLETFVTDSLDSPNPADWKTEIYIALKE